MVAEELCPICNSRTIMLEFYGAVDDKFYRNGYCMNCGAEWMTEYKIESIKAINIKTDNNKVRLFE